MAGNIKTNSVQLGDSATATQNFVLQTNVDGTAKLARGNVGATTQDILTVDAAGKAAFPQMPFVGSAPVVESGSNVNGSYVKFADGTMICHLLTTLGPLNINIGYGGAYISTPLSWTFPVAFYAAPSVTLFGRSGAGISWPMQDIAPLATAYYYYLVCLGSLTATIFNLSGTAIGRWKA